MRGLTKLGFALLLVFSFSLLALAAELLFLLRRRHLRGSRSADPEIAGGCFLFSKNRSRVEPAVAAITPSAKPSPPQAAAEEEDDGDLALWRAMYLGPSRVLYTIDEEAESGDEDEDLESETPFYTPSSSPPRAVEEALVSSRPVDRKVEISVPS